MSATGSKGLPLPASAAAARLGLRLLAALPGCYALTALAVTLAAVPLAGLGMARAEAVTLAAMAGLLVYPALLLWAFSVASVARLWLALAAGAAALAALLRYVS